MNFRRCFKPTFLLLCFFIQLTAAYAGIKFEWDDSENKKGLPVTITTDRLILKSVVEEDILNLIKLFSDPEVMKKFGAGTPRDDKQRLRE